MLEEPVQPRRGLRKRETKSVVDTAVWGSTVKSGRHCETTSFMTEHSTHGKVSFWKLPSKEERPHKLMALFWGGWREKKPTSSGLLIGVSGVRVGEL